MSVELADEELMLRIRTILDPILSALPENANEEELGNILAAVATEYVTDKAILIDVFMFGFSVACAQSDYMAQRKAGH